MSGGITRGKGSTKGKVLEVELSDSPIQEGQVFITASGESEDAQESDEIQGSFFTHFFTSGLRGPADRDNNNIVTLTEAYSYAYQRTVATTAETRSGTLRPSASDKSDTRWMLAWKRRLVLRFECDTLCPN